MGKRSESLVAVALVKRCHPRAVEVIGEKVTSEEETWIRRYLEAIRPVTMNRRELLSLGVVALLPQVRDSSEVYGTTEPQLFGRALPIADGTYTLGMWAAINRVVTLWGETNTYRGTSPPSDADFLVGSATTLEPYALISSAANCNNCHNDLYFHGGGRRGFDTCVLCHGTAGAEDRPRYVAANAPATTQLSINFREMLHKIHRGEELDHASTYTVVGFGSTAYPNNFGLASYGEVVFPTMPAGVKQCTTCHGTLNTAWIEPSARTHPAGQLLPTRAWRAACGSCHDSDAAQAHIDSQTSPSGAEACAVCHDPDGLFNVELMHKVR
jgi:OmcA/MtrC family decaheme c-type cytochrome